MKTELEKAIVAVMEGRDKIKASELCLLVREAVGNENLSSTAIGRAARAAGLHAKQGAKGVRFWENLQPANLQPANLQPANLQPANLQPANLQPANLQPANLQPVMKETKELKGIEDFAFLTDEKLNTPEAVNVLLSFDLDNLRRVSSFVRFRLNPENRTLFEKDVLKKSKEYGEELYRLKLEESRRKWKEAASQPPPPEQLEKEVEDAKILLRRNEREQDWRRKVAGYDPSCGKSWSEYCYPDEWKTDIEIPLEVRKRMAFTYLRQFKVKLTSKESEIIKKQIKAGTDYYLTGNRETMDKFIACILLRNYPRNWELRSTYDTVAYYLSDEEGIPPSCDVKTPILLVEYRDHLPENKLTEQLNLHLLTERQAKKLITIFIGRAPFPCVKDLCENIHCGKKVAVKGAKGGEIL